LTTRRQRWRGACWPVLLLSAALLASCVAPSVPGPESTRVRTRDVAREVTRPALARVEPAASAAGAAPPTDAPTRTPPPATPVRPTATVTASPPPPTPSPTYESHTVQAEDTLFGIAALYSVAVEALVEANRLADANLLQEGQELLIPPPAGRPTPAHLAERDYGYAIIGFSAGGRAIEVFSFGEGPNHVVFVGGIHGGYEWNTVLLAHEVIDYFNAYREDIPPGVTLDIIPVANPDGLFLVTGSAGRFAPEWVGEPATAGRFNGNGVDLNRNWDCNWSASARWGGRNVDPGNAPFSEPETRALRDYLLALSPRAVIFWHSMANLVAPGSCDGADAGSGLLATTYGEAAGYPVGPFTVYEVTGDASTWAAAQGLPAIIVELATKDSSESGRNLAGVIAVLERYSR
jgi:LysM repeat protein